MKKNITQKIIIPLTLLFLTNMVFAVNQQFSSVEKQQVTVNNKVTSILGDGLLRVGDKINNTTLILPTGTFDTMKKVPLTKYKGYKVILSVPSIDTPVCSKQTVILENLAKSHPKVNFLVISADLPFALNRFCADHSIKNLKVLSDFQDYQFAKQNKLFLVDYHLLTRAVLIVDNNNIVKYVNYASEVTNELDLTQIEGILKTFKK